MLNRPNGRKRIPPGNHFLGNAQGTALA